jgi:23S rRNA (adenine2503-C2)-methyltransferase
MPEFITNLTVKQIKDLVISLDEPAYRAKQLLGWVYRKLAVSWDEMTDLPLSFRQKLAAQTNLHTLTPRHEVKAKDGTVKILFSLPDGKTVETALMKFKAVDGRHRYTVCVSTQVGCPIGCPFCATGQQGFERNLTPGEIIDQVLYFARWLKDNSKGIEGEKIDNIVFMGMGEPLANYDALWQAIETLNSADTFGLSARSMTISTSGLIPGIKRLGGEKMQVGLAISLHAPDDKLRNQLVPVNKKYPLDKLIPACREYFTQTGRRVSFEYALFDGVNDSLTQAQELADLLQGLNCHVNLISANSTANQTLRQSPPSQVLAFQQELKNRGINCTLRQSRGQDIDAGCGQLRSRFLAQK